jgi:hypothetical protein
MASSRKREFIVQVPPANFNSPSQSRGISPVLCVR